MAGPKRYMQAVREPHLWRVKCDDTFRIWMQTFWICKQLVDRFCVARSLDRSNTACSFNKYRIHGGHETKIRSKNQIVLFGLWCFFPLFFSRFWFLNVCIFTHGKTKQHRTRIDCFFFGFFSVFCFFFHFVADEAIFCSMCERWNRGALSIGKTVNVHVASTLSLARIHTCPNGAKYVIHIVRHYKSHYLISSGVVVFFSSTLLSTLLSCKIFLALKCANIIWWCIKVLLTRTRDLCNGNCQWFRIDF